MRRPFSFHRATRAQPNAGPTKGRTEHPRLTGGTRLRTPTGIEHTEMAGGTRGKAAASAHTGNPFSLFLGKHHVDLRLHLR